MRAAQRLTEEAIETRKGIVLDVQDRPRIEPESRGLTGCAVEMEMMVRGLLPTDIPEICSWVRSPHELASISSRNGHGLTEPILQEWVEYSKAEIVIARAADNLAAAFCVLSTTESKDLPQDMIEVCHFVVSQRFRYAWTASRLIDQARAEGQALGAARVAGRILPTNRPMRAVLAFKGCEEFEQRPRWAAPGFRWYWAPTGSARLPRTNRLRY